LHLSDRRSVVEWMVVPWHGTHLALGCRFKLYKKRIDIIYRSVPFWKRCNVRSTKGGCETLGWGSARSPVQISSAISLAVVVCFITRCFAPPRLLFDNNVNREQPVQALHLKATAGLISAFVSLNEHESVCY